MPMRGFSVSLRAWRRSRDRFSPNAGTSCRCSGSRSRFAGPAHRPPRRWRRRVGGPVPMVSCRKGARDRRSLRGCSPGSIAGSPGGSSTHLSRSRAKSWRRCDPRRIKPGAEELFATLVPQLASSVHRVHLEREVKLDPLTGVPGRRAPEGRLQKAYRDAYEKGRPFAVIMCDIDFFKRINDTHGHAPATMRWWRSPMPSRTSAGKGTSVVATGGGVHPVARGGRGGSGRCNSPSACAGRSRRSTSCSRSGRSR